MDKQLTSAPGNSTVLISDLDMASVVISIENGFRFLETEGISGCVWEKDGFVYKLTKRNSIDRAKRDLAEYKKLISDFPGKIPQSEVIRAILDNEEYTCIKQPFINAPTIKSVSKDALIQLLKSSSEDRKFVELLLKEFFSRVDEKRLYPDIVGYPKDPDFFNSINMLVTKDNGLMLCDVGLSPHEDTLARFGTDFYNSANVAVYRDKMGQLESLLACL